MKTKLNFVSFLVIIGLTFNHQKSFGQSAIGQLEKMTGQKITVPKANPSANFNNMVVGTIFQSLLSAALSPNTNSNQQAAIEAQKAAELAQKKAAEEQRKADSIAQVNYDKMMQSYKTLGDSNLDFKSLNNSDETLRANALKQFEPDAITPTATNTTQIESSTPFFDETIPIEDLQTLADPENNPNVVNLREANKYVEEKVATDSLDIVSLLRNNIDANGSPIIEKIKCVDVSRKLNAFLDQRNKFKKTILLSQNELETWETANNNALMNAAKDGLEYFTGELLGSITKRGLAADRLQGILDKNAKRMAKQGINISEIQEKINNLRSLSTAGQLADLTSKMNDWSSFVKDGMSSLLTNLTNSNNEINQFFEDPNLQKYFETEKPELSTLLDISKIAASNAVFGKWVAKKVPMIGLVDISIKQIYNATDWITSFYRISKARQINGGVLDAAKYIQQKIDASYIDLKNCSN